jgi:hypothetical protein
MKRSAGSRSGAYFLIIRQQFEDNKKRRGYDGDELILGF